MIKEVLQSIEGIGIYPTISLLLFFTVFVMMLIRTFRLDRNYRNKMKNMPLERENNARIDRAGENG